MDLHHLEEIDIVEWELLSETPTHKEYHKSNLTKRITLYENYSLEENYKNDQLHGATIGRMNTPFLHLPEKKSKIYLVENYSEDNLEGTSLSFFEDGSKVQQEWKHNKLNGKSVAWFGNGQKEKEETFIDGVLNGKKYEWYENGLLKLDQNFIQGIQTGDCLLYLNNGLLKRRKTYVNGKVEGLVYELWEFKGKVTDGGVYSETEYRNNTKNGREIVYFPNMIKMREGIYFNGVEEGERIWWSKNGTISIREHYKNGELNGKRILYNELGELESVQHYELGERVS
ncbi:toxin-antitoxin system YwqK family antitoxin [Portibacter lacus]|uniref:Toxin-antitoxin system YwqK family antitoxin n=1 Tax=Portibacter lacus TaxID=1099794 RepID=A0AA37WGI6_9BACT|nr:hypothetical protein [Portibacter lacus]GLR19917.1 hypothetical protein GCM10007940_45330 [Portibacter lacus]